MPRLAGGPAADRNHAPGSRSGGARAALLAYRVKTAVVLTDKGRAGDEKDEVSSHREGPHKMEIPMSIRTGLIAALYTASVRQLAPNPSFNARASGKQPSIQANRLLAVFPLILSSIGTTSCGRCRNFRAPIARSAILPPWAPSPLIRCNARSVGAQ